MLKITVNDRTGRLVLEGSLSGPWVRTLEDCWRSAVAKKTPQNIAVDLSNVTFVDRAGRQLLSSIHQAGSGLFAIGINLALVQEVAQV